MDTIKLLILKYKLKLFENRNKKHCELGNVDNWYNKFGIPDLKNQIDLVLYSKKKKMFDKSLKRQKIKNINILYDNNKMIEIKYDNGFIIREKVK